MDWVIVGLSCAVPLLIVAGIAVTWFVRVGRVAGAATQIKAEFERDGDLLRFEPGVTCYGRQVRRSGQIRGLGALALEPAQLTFVLYNPRKTVVIPRSTILGVERTTSHLEHVNLTPLLRVRWTRRDGSADAMAWQVADLEGWLRDLSQPGLDVPPAPHEPRTPRP
jgi:hypothetical protein